MFILARVVVHPWLPIPNTYQRNQKNLLDENYAHISTSENLRHFPIRYYGSHIYTKYIKYIFRSHLVNDWYMHKYVVILYPFIIALIKIKLMKFVSKDGLHIASSE